MLLSGIQLFSNGTCDVLVTISPLSESQAAHLVRHAPRQLENCLISRLPAFSNTPLAHQSLFISALIVRAAVQCGQHELRLHEDSRVAKWNAAFLH